MSKENKSLTVEELNSIQAEWMALSTDAPKSEVARVCRLMDSTPKRYVSGHDGKGVVMIDGGPFNQPMDFDYCLEICKKFGGRTDIAWNGKIGQWYSLTPR